jgi:hypothetical protein
MDLPQQTLAFIKSNHPESRLAISDNIVLFLKPGSSHLMGYSAATYIGNSWVILIGHAITPQMIYEIKADFDDGKIAWTGIFRNGQFEEYSYNNSI